MQLFLVNATLLELRLPLTIATFTTFHISHNCDFVSHMHIYFKFKLKVKLSFIVIPLHVGTYSGTKCRASQDHGAT